MCVEGKITEKELRDVLQVEKVYVKSAGLRWPIPNNKEERRRRRSYYG